MGRQSVTVLPHVVTNSMCGAVQSGMRVATAHAFVLQLLPSHEPNSESSLATSSQSSTANRLDLSNALWHGAW